MVHVHVGHDGRVERKQQMSPITLVGLDHESIRTRPSRAGSDVAHIATDDETHVGATR